MITRRSTNIFLYCLIIYFIVLLLLAPTNLLSFDTYYYWDWSRHLAMSYYDGAPLIAYFIRLSTLLFGDTLFALSLVGIVSAATTSVIIYHTARLFLSKESSYVALLLWLLSPLVTLDILKQTTYDTPLMLFWSLTIFCTAKFILSNHIRWFYAASISIGLMMLSKYSGIILVLSLFVFLLTTPYRYLFKTIHLYWGLLLIIFLFSPVLLWNYQHEWQSFIYQLTSHQLESHTNAWSGVLNAIFGHFIPALNFMLIPPFLYWFNRHQLRSAPENNSPMALINHQQTPTLIYLCWIICITFLGFYLVTATKAAIRECWLAPYLISSALLGGFCFQRLGYRKLTFLLIGIYGVVSSVILINNSPQFSITTPPKLINYRFIQQFNKNYPELPKTLITTGWLEARMLFFLKNKPQAYTIDCGSPHNQYALWSKDINQKIKDKTLKEVLFIDTENRVACAEKYFNHCTRLPLPIYLYKKREYSFYAYRCTN